MSVEEERQENIRMLRESAAAVCDRSDLSRIRHLRYSEPGFDRETWKSMAELGWLGMRLPEERGGSGLGMLEYCALAEELGGALVPEPLIAGALCAQLLHGEDLAQLIEGDLLVLPALNDAAPGQHVIFREGRLNGSKRSVPSPTAADKLVVSTDAGVVLVDGDAAGLEIEDHGLQDGCRAGTVTFRDVAATALNAGIAAAVDDAALATAAYLLGLMDAALARTLDYLTTRKQFNTLIGSFQSLQHIAVDMKLQCALTRASVEDAARLRDDGADPDIQAAAISRAKARASDAALLVTRLGVQLHGGIGYSDEHDIGLYLRKAMVLAPAFGGSRFHRQRYFTLSAADAKNAA